MEVCEEAKLSTSVGSRFTCICCHVKFDSSILQREHFKTEWHSYNLKRKICSLEPIDLESFAQIDLAIPDGTDSFMIDDDSSSDASSDWEDLDYPSEDESDIINLLNTAMPQTTCFFCEKNSSSIKSNVVHMNEYHGFFIPEERYLANLEGLIDYLRFKVGAAATCLWCDKQFADVKAVQLHMQHKDHCKIKYDHNNAIGQYRQFYDYSEQPHIDMKPLNQLATRKRRRTKSEPRALARVSIYTDRAVSHRYYTNLIGGTIIDEGTSRRAIKRARIALKTTLSNNRTMRPRMRLQNPK